ncbi:MAG: hypothetical protein JSU63_15200 [Phycisphaerales bacterium]|nr:MAG: hypothetical protein JSU63_15200 [Phycisphaerales bacterium]
MLRLMCASAVVMLAVTAVGCAKNERTTFARSMRNEHMIFNPVWNDIPSGSNVRADWPATVKYNQERETFRYRETVFDRQGPIYSSRDLYYRRFDATREGSGYR